MDNSLCTPTVDDRTDAVRADGGTDPRGVGEVPKFTRTVLMNIAANQSVCENRSGVNHV